MLALTVSTAATMRGSGDGWRAAPGLRSIWRISYPYSNLPPLVSPIRGRGSPAEPTLAASSPPFLGREGGLGGLGPPPSSLTALRLAVGHSSTGLGCRTSPPARDALTPALSQANKGR